MENTSVSYEQPQCYVHDEFRHRSEYDIREIVCVKNLSLIEHTDGKHYCLFHLPTKDKDLSKFTQIFNERLESIKQKAARTENFPEDIRNREKYNLILDLSYVWFPSKIDFWGYNFNYKVIFSWATFSEEVNFVGATFDDFAHFSHAKFLDKAAFTSIKFLGDTSFTSATFSAGASFGTSIFSDRVSFRSAKFLANGEFGGYYDNVGFNNVIFSAGADFGEVVFLTPVDFQSANFLGLSYFRSVQFSAYASFLLATFSSNVIFDLAIFSADCYFSSTTFNGNTSFNGTKFNKNNTANFSNSKFNNDTFFDWAEFNGKVSFNSAIFGSNSDVFFRNTLFSDIADFLYCTADGYLRFGNLRQSKESRFDFQEAAFEKAARVSFRSVRLRPSWFINIDTRKIIFTDILWENVENDFYRTNVKKELDSLMALGIKKPTRLFKIVCRQLAENAENNNRFEESSNFRKMAFECEWIEKKGNLYDWINRLPDESDKLKRRFSGLQGKDNNPIPPTNSFGIIKQFDFVHLLYRYTSFYGESWRWALGVLLGIWFVFALVYTQLNFAICPINKSGEKEVSISCVTRTLLLSEGMKQSLGTMFLQKSDNRKPLETAETLVLIEMIIAPIQAALLALAIRRKFMR